MKGWDVALAAGAAARLTRLLTEDSLGRWYFRGPVEAWGDRAELAAIDAAKDQPDGGYDRLSAYDPDFPWTWQKRLSEGASCRWCVGFWIGVLVLAATVLCPRPLRPLLRFGFGALTLNVASNAVGRWTGTLS